MKFLFFFLPFIFFNIGSSNAQYIYGCVSDDTGLIYPDRISGRTYDITNPTQPNQGDFCNPQPAGSCQMRVSFNCRGCTGPDKNGWYYQAGSRYSFVECPIDDYIPFIIMLVSGTGFLFIRKRVYEFNI